MGQLVRVEITRTSNQTFTVRVQPSDGSDSPRIVGVGIQGDDVAAALDLDNTGTSKTYHANTIYDLELKIKNYFYFGNDSAA